MIQRYQQQFQKGTEAYTSWRIPPPEDLWPYDFFFNFLFLTPPPLLFLFSHHLHLFLISQSNVFTHIISYYVFPTISVKSNSCHHSYWEKNTFSDGD